MQLSLHPVPESLIHQIEDLAFKAFKTQETKDRCVYLSAYLCVLSTGCCLCSVYAILHEDFLVYYVMLYIHTGSSCLWLIMSLY